MRSLIVAVVLTSGLAHAEPSSDARADLAAGVASANEAQWEAALASLDRVVAAAPDWSEAYYVRAGIETNLAGDVPLRQLAYLDRKVDYDKMAALLDRAAADLDRYLALEPEAPNAIQVAGAKAILHARADAARANALKVAALLAAEHPAAEERADELRRPPVMTDLTAVRRIGVDLGVRAVDGQRVASAAIAARVVIRDHVAIDARFAVATGQSSDAALPDDGASIGAVVLGGAWLHDVGGRVRVGGGARVAVPIASEPADGAVHDQLVAAPMAFVESWAVEPWLGARLAHARGFAQLEVDAAVARPRFVGRASLGGGVHLGRHLAALASITTASVRPDDGDAELAHEVRLGLATRNAVLGVAVPLGSWDDVGPAITLGASLAW